MARLDCGVVLYLTGAGGQTAVNDIDGAPITATAISAAGPPGAWQASATRTLVAGQLALYALAGVLQAGVQSVKARVERQRVDANNPTAWSWASIESVRADTGVGAVEHTITAANLVSVFNTGQARDVILQTTDADMGGKVRLIVQAQAAVIGPDILVAALEILTP